MDLSLEPITTLIHRELEGALGTLEDESPCVSGVGYTIPSRTTNLLNVTLLLSELSRHTRNIKRNPRVSLFISEAAPERLIYERRRVTLFGIIERVTDPNDVLELKASFLTRFPGSQIFFELPDFHFYHLQPTECHWIGGFGQAATYSFRGDGWIRNG